VRLRASVALLLRSGGWASPNADHGSTDSDGARRTAQADRGNPEDRDVTIKNKTEIEPGIGRTVDMLFETALERAREALQKEGFGVLTQIDVKSTLKEKLNADVSPFVILGACNPRLAHRALELDPQVGLLLPCNVVVRDLGGGKVRVEAINALAMMSLFPAGGLEPIARQVNERLSRVVAAV
jgi:uncharacterized protein (DUF302 family)